MASVLPMPVKPTNAALGHGLVALLRQRPEGDVQHVVERTHLQGHGLFKRFKVKRCGTARPKALRTKRVRMMGPRSQQPYEGRGCSPQGLVAAMSSQ